MQVTFGTNFATRRRQGAILTENLSMNLSTRVKNVFYVLLTVHLGVTLVNNQIDAQFFFLICLLQLSTCFEQHRAHHQEN
jgi:hypothetical protein